MTLKDIILVRNEASINDMIDVLSVNQKIELRAYIYVKVLRFNQITEIANNIKSRYK